jgi:hypothetical protein
MQDIQHFLSTLERGLDRFQQRIKSSGSHCPVVKYLPDGKRTVSADEVAIGTGKFELAGPDTSPPAEICLNDKQADSVLKKWKEGAPDGRALPAKTRARDSAQSRTSFSTHPASCSSSGAPS